MYYLTGIFFTAILVFREGEGFEKSFLFLFSVLQFGSWSILFTIPFTDRKVSLELSFFKFKLSFLPGPQIE